MKTIVVIDDDKVNNYLCELSIKAVAKKSIIECYTNPLKAAKSILEKDNDTVILLDLNMPEMSGWQFLDYLKDKKIDYPVYILTSSIDPYDKQNAENYPNVKNFFSKPINSENVIEMIY